MHLTNYSINKKNQDVYTPNNDEDACQGHKWYHITLRLNIGSVIP